MKPTKLAMVIGVLCSPAPAALANEQANEPAYYLQEMVVSASRTEQDVRDVAASVSTISAAELQQKQAQNLQQAFAAEPGVSLTHDGHVGLGGFNIRGMSGDRVKTLIDGVELPNSYNAASGRSNYMNVINKNNNGIELDTLASLEVNKGPVSSLYGSDALGGAVVLRTKTPADLLREGEQSAVQVSSGYHDANQAFKGTVEWAARAGSLETLLIYTHREGKEQETYYSGSSDLVGTDRDRADPLTFDSDNYFAKAYYRLSPQQRIGLTAEYFTKNQEVQRYSMYSDIYQNAVAVTDEDRLRVSLEHLWQSDASLFDQWQWTLAYMDSQTHQDNFEYTTYNRNRIRSAEDTSWQAELQLTKTLALGQVTHELVYGGSAVRNKFSLDYQELNLDTEEYEEGSAAPVPNVTETKYGLFLQDQMYLLGDQLVLTLGGRYDHYEAEPNAASGYASVSNASITGRAGATYHWTPSFSSYAQISQGFKSPTAEQLFYNYEHNTFMGLVYIAPNPDLKAEKSISYELGWRYFTPATKMNFAVYYNDYSDFIDRRSIDATHPLYPESGAFIAQTSLNIDNAEIYGLEFSANWDLAAMADGINAGVNTTFMKGKDKDSGTAIDSISPLTATANFGYDSPARTFGSALHVTAVAGKSGADWSNASNLSAPGYTKMDLTAYYQPFNDFFIRAGVFNLTDKKYWDYMNLSGVTTSNSYNSNRLTESGRNIGVDVSYRF